MSNVLSADRGMYPGLIRDLKGATSLGDIFDVLPEAGQRVESAPCLVRDHQGNVIPVQNQKIIRNAETLQPYSVVTDTYCEYQHSESLKTVQSLLNHGGTLDQGGSLAKGGTIWVSVAMPEKTIIQADGEDVLIPKMMVFSDHTTGNANMVLSFFERVWCNNMLTSLIKGAQVKFSIVHRGRIAERSEMVRQIVTDAASGMSASLEVYQKFAQTDLSPSLFQDFAVSLLDDHRGSAEQVDEYGNVSLHHKRENDIAELEEYFGTGNQGAGNTAWGAYQSVTAWIDHKHERLDEAKATRSKLESMWKSGIMGENSRLKERAFRKLENYTLCS